METTKKRIYMVLSRREVLRMLKYIGNNNEMASCGVFDIELNQEPNGEDMQAYFTQETETEIRNSCKKGQ